MTPPVNSSARTVDGLQVDADESRYRAKIYASDFYPDARFRVVSDELAYEPDVPVQEGEGFLEALYWRDFGTRVIRYENTAERVLFFPAEDAPVERGAAYRAGEIRSTEELANGVVTVGFDPAPDGDERGE